MIASLAVVQCASLSFFNACHMREDRAPQKESFSSEIIGCLVQADDVGGDIKKAFEWLRKKGAATIAKTNRSANEGLIGLAVQGSTGVLVEVRQSCSVRLPAESEFVFRPGSRVTQPPPEPATLATPRRAGEQ